jgi:hypothetical protein
MCTIYAEIMDGRVVPLARSRRVGRSAASDIVTAVCARPKCRKEFQRSLTRGRRKLYCTEECRRQVDAERRKTRARLRHYEDNVAKLRADDNTYASAGAAAVGGAVNAEEELRTQLARVQGLLVFADRDDPVVQHLADLATAVAQCLDTAAEGIG